MHSCRSVCGFQPPHALPHALLLGPRSRCDTRLSSAFPRTRDLAYAAMSTHRCVSSAVRPRRSRTTRRDDDDHHQDDLYLGDSVLARTCGTALIWRRKFLLGRSRACLPRHPRHLCGNVNCIPCGECARTAGSRATLPVQLTIWYKPTDCEFQVPHGGTRGLQDYRRSPTSFIMLPFSGLDFVSASSACPSSSPGTALACEKSTFGPRGKWEHRLLLPSSKSWMSGLRVIISSHPSKMAKQLG